jgi:hypothetical protein
MDACPPGPKPEHIRYLLDSEMPGWVPITRRTATVQAAMEGRVFVLNPQRGWIEGDAGMRETIRRIVKMNGPLHEYGAEDVTGSAAYVPGFSFPAPLYAHQRVMLDAVEPVAVVDATGAATPECVSMLDTIAPVLPHYADLIESVRGVLGGGPLTGPFATERDRMIDDMERVDALLDRRHDDERAAWALGALSNLCDIVQSTLNARNCLASMRGLVSVPPVCAPPTVARSVTVGVRDGIPSDSLRIEGTDLEGNAVVEVVDVPAVGGFAVTVGPLASVGPVTIERAGDAPEASALAVGDGFKTVESADETPDVAARRELTEALSTLSVSWASILLRALVSAWEIRALRLNLSIAKCNEATDNGGCFKADGVTNDEPAYEALCADVEAAGLSLNAIGWVIVALCDSQDTWDFDESAIVWEDSVDEGTQCWTLLDVAGTVASLRSLA